MVDNGLSFEALLRDIQSLDNIKYSFETDFGTFSHGADGKWGYFKAGSERQLVAGIVYTYPQRAKEVHFGSSRGRQHSCEKFADEENLPNFGINKGIFDLNLMKYFKEECSAWVPRNSDGKLSIGEANLYYFVEQQPGRFKLNDAGLVKKIEILK